VRQRRPGGVRVLREPRIGLSTARNAGVRAARGEVVAFTDDDAFPDPGWLRALLSALEPAGTLVAGGPVAPLFEGQLPAWFTARFLPYLAAWDRGPEGHPLVYNEYPRGNNIAFRREVFARFGGFTRHLGRTGRSLLSCEETELCLRVERGGGAIVYAPAARVRHLTAAGRLTTDWLERRFFAQGRSEAIVEWRHGGWAGLRRGWERWRRMLVDAERQRTGAADGPLYARCVRRALFGHSCGAMAAPLTVPRYRPAAGARPWRLPS
jgi:GT2 family glycosyltransferase